MRLLEEYWMKRDPYFDNAKAILIILVVLGHTLSEVFNRNEWIATIYMFIYLFHMPAFVLVSGFFSRKMKGKKDLLNLVKKLLIPYILFQIIYTLYYQNVFKDEMVEFTLLTPRWALWYLLSLFSWNIMLLLFDNKKTGVFFAILLSLLVGYLSEVNEFLALSRTFFFFPFFLTGYFLTNKHFEWFKTKLNGRVSLLTLGILFAVVYFYGNIEWREWLYGRVGYEDIMSGPTTFAFLNRLFIYIMMSLATYCFLSIVPKRKMGITSLGSITLGIYLFHMFLLKYVHESFFFEWVKDSHQYYLLFIIPIIIVYILTRKPLVKIECLLTGAKLMKNMPSILTVSNKN